MVALATARFFGSVNPPEILESAADSDCVRAHSVKIGKMRLCGVMFLCSGEPLRSILSDRDTFPIIVIRYLSLGGFRIIKIFSCGLIWTSIRLAELVFSVERSWCVSLVCVTDKTQFVNLAHPCPVVTSFCVLSGKRPEHALLGAHRTSLISGHVPFAVAFN